MSARSALVELTRSTAFCCNIAADTPTARVVPDSAV